MFFFTLIIVSHDPDEGFISSIIFLNGQVCITYALNVHVHFRKRRCFPTTSGIVTFKGQSHSVVMNGSLCVVFSVRTIVDSCFDKNKA